MKIHKTVNTQALENTYYLENEHHLLIIDPGSDWSVIQQKITELNKPIAAILLTHTHYDHIMSLDLVRKTFQSPPVYVAESEAAWLSSPNDNLSGLDRHSDLKNLILKPAEYTFSYQEDYNLEDFHFYVLETPGHSIGGVSFVFPKEHCVFTGDALFRETIGRADLPTGNLNQLLTSIETQLFTLPNYDVYPGHGPQTSIGHEKMFNPFFKKH